MKFTQIIFLITLVLTIGSCKKQTTEDNDWTSMQDQNTADMNSDLVLKEIEGAANGSDLGKSSFPIVVLDTVANTKTMTIDYGTANYLCGDGHYRRGKIIVSWTGKYREVGSVKAISFDTFFQNDNKIEGSKTITNIGVNDVNQLAFNVVSIIKITNPSGESINWTSTRTRTWIQGVQTKSNLDDVYSITGSTTGKNRKGKNYTSTITTPLRVEIACQWRIVSGTIELIREGGSPKTIDFGSGACDASFTVSSNGKTYTVVRRK
jgi:hypothetical protein